MNENKQLDKNHFNFRLHDQIDTIKQTSKIISEGDRIQLEDRGTVEVISLKLTKRERWRVEMLRN